VSEKRVRPNIPQPIRPDRVADHLASGESAAEHIPHTMPLPNGPKGHIEKYFGGLLDLQRWVSPPPDFLDRLSDDEEWKRKVTWIVAKSLWHGLKPVLTAAVFVGVDARTRHFDRLEYRAHEKKVAIPIHHDEPHADGADSDRGGIETRNVAPATTIIPPPASQIQIDAPSQVSSEAKELQPMSPERQGWEIFFHTESPYLDRAHSDSHFAWYDAVHKRYRDFVLEIVKASDKPTTRPSSVLHFFFEKVGHQDSKNSFMQIFDNARYSSCQGRLRGVLSTLEVMGYDVRTQLACALYSDHEEPLMRTAEGTISLDGTEPKPFEMKPGVAVVSFADFKRMALGLEPENPPEMIAPAETPGTGEATSTVVPSVHVKIKGLAASGRDSALRYPSYGDWLKHDEDMPTDEVEQRHAQAPENTDAYLPEPSSQEGDVGDEDATTDPEKSESQPSLTAVQIVAPKPHPRAIHIAIDRAEQVGKLTKQWSQSRVVQMLVATLATGVGGYMITRPESSPAPMEVSEKTDETVDTSESYRVARRQVISLSEYYQTAQEVIGESAELGQDCEPVGIDPITHAATQWACQRYSDIEFLFSLWAKEGNIPDRPISDLTITLPHAVTTDPYFWEELLRSVEIGVADRGGVEFGLAQHSTVRLDGENLQRAAVVESLVLGTELRQRDRNVDDLPMYDPAGYVLEVVVNNETVGRVVGSIDGWGALELTPQALNDWMISSSTAEDIPLWARTVQATSAL
jgi:hypothetical protein